MQPKDVTALKGAVRAMYGCESLHVESVPVKKVFAGRILADNGWLATQQQFAGNQNVPG